MTARAPHEGALPNVVVEATQTTVVDDTDAADAARCDICGWRLDPVNIADGHRTHPCCAWPCQPPQPRTGHNLQHGMTRTGAWRSWVAMKDRCANPNRDGWHRYGGRGIRVCERWLDSFANFYADMGARPPGMSLDRIDPDGNYEPGNCRWADAITQRHNRGSR